MRLNSILVSSFLSLSAVLADRLPLLATSVDHVRRSTDFPDDISAGGVWQGGETQTVSKAKSSVVIPGVLKGDPGSAFTIASAIGGIGCHSVFAAGINVDVTENGVVYEAWGQWYSDIRFALPDRFPISAGDEIEITLELFSPTAGSVTLLNKSRRTRWQQSLNGGAVCDHTAAWIIQLRENPQARSGYFPLPNFETLSFTNMEIKANEVVQVPEFDELLTIREGGKVVTEVVSYGNFIHILYLP